MTGLANALTVLKSLGAAKVATALTAVTLAGTLAVGATGPVPPAGPASGSPAVGHGPTNPVALAARAAHGSPGAAPTSSPAAPGSPGAAAASARAAVVTRLAADEARLLKTLEAVLTRLEANPNANDHAVTALTNVIARAQAADHGLGRAATSVAAGGAPAATTHPDSSTRPSLPPQANPHAGGPANP